LFAKIFFMGRVRTHRQDAIDRSKSVILWTVQEKIAPLLPHFPYSTKDLVFVGKWVDYIVFDGLSDWQLRQVVFLEIKTGRSTLNANEKQIQRVIDQGNIRYDVMRLH
jgi:predicted Holliday junction resolvase-like endonuclease